MKMSQTTKLKITNQARKLLWHKGYSATSLNQVVDDAGVSKGAFFHYYKSKEAISRDVIADYVEEVLLQPLDRALENNHNVKNALLEWMTDIFKAFSANEFIGGCLLGNMALELSDINEVAREDFKHHFLSLENKLARALKPLMAENKLLIEYRQLARLLIATMQGTLMMGKVHKDKNRASREFQAIAQLIEYAIKD